MGILHSRVLERAGFRHAFPTRDVPTTLVRASLGIERLVTAKQVHGARAVLAGEASGQEADAIVCRASPTDAAIAVGIATADCVPVLLGDEASGDVAAIHAGWRGVVGGVVKAGVDLLGGRQLVAAIGPCIAACCFEVGPEVADAVGFVVKRTGDKAYVDLRAAVRAQLRGLGVEDARIEDVEGCTKHDPRFHSYRRDGAHSGRMVSSIAPRGHSRMSP